MNGGTHGLVGKNLITAGREDDRLPPLTSVLLQPDIGNFGYEAEELEERRLPFRADESKSSSRL